MNTNKLMFGPVVLNIVFAIFTNKASYFHPFACLLNSVHQCWLQMTRSIFHTIRYKLLNFSITCPCLELVGKCIKMNTSKPMFGPVVLDIVLTIFTSYFHLFAYYLLNSTTMLATEDKFNFFQKFLIVFFKISDFDNLMSKLGISRENASK